MGPLVPLRRGATGHSSGVGRGATDASMQRPQQRRRSGSAAVGTPYKLANPVYP
jgi:hypothetical protein